MAVHTEKNHTPGRPQKKGNQFFDIGKVGRKTGITLEDKGIRDEHGLEPVEHIFSSPVKVADTSIDLLAHEGLEDVQKALPLRRTPRLPPPRASTPKHTNIGSPKRMSTTGRRISQRLSVQPHQDSSPVQSGTQPPVNRVIDFNGNGVHKSIESPSPFKHRMAVRKSIAIPQDVFASPGPEPQPVPSDADVDGGAENHEAEVEPQIDDAPMLLNDDDDFYDAMPDHGSGEADEEHHSSRIQLSSSSTKSSGKKRDRSLVEDDSQAHVDQDLSQSQISVSGRASKKQRGGKQKNNRVRVLSDTDHGTIDPTLLAYDNGIDAGSVQDLEPEPAPVDDNKAQGKGKAKAKKSKAPKERDPNRAMRTGGSPVKLNDSPSKLRNSRESSRGISTGPYSNYQLRATTPFEDAGSRISRYGRNLIQPLKYWANEKQLWNRGEIEGVTRAEEVVKTKRPTKRSKKGRKGKLGDIDEDSDAESVAPDEWEENVCIISGLVANWDSEAQAGNPEDLIREDLAFSSSAIVTRDVKGSDFRYAKIMTLGFFGSGIVELPPNGMKRVKNSRKMHMCFFVHEGKVMVEVGATSGAEPGERNEFAVSKGGVWMVPRGNNYAITNESSTRTARIFFAQACEMAPGTSEAVQETSQ